MRACAELTGLKRYYYSTGLSADDIWTRVRANSMTGSTFNPMVAWTYSSGAKAPGGGDLGVGRGICENSVTADPSSHVQAELLLRTQS